MKYIDKDDLISLSFERFIDESSENDTKILDEIEATQIGIIKSLLASRYNVAAIFDETDPIKDEILTNILATLVLYGIIRRNAPRKVTTDLKEERDRANSTLEKIATGRITLHGLPLPVDESGNGMNSNTLYGNNTNEDFYI